MREKALQLTSEEVPHAISVEVDELDREARPRDDLRRDRVAEADPGRQGRLGGQADRDRAPGRRSSSCSATRSSSTSGSRPGRSGGATRRCSSGSASDAAARALRRRRHAVRSARPRSRARPAPTRSRLLSSRAACRRHRESRPRGQTSTADRPLVLRNAGLDDEQIDESLAVWCTPSAIATSSSCPMPTRVLAGGAGAPKPSPSRGGRRPPRAPHRQPRAVARARMERLGSRLLPGGQGAFGCEPSERASWSRSPRTSGQLARSARSRSVTRFATSIPRTRPRSARSSSASSRTAEEHASARTRSAGISAAPRSSSCLVGLAPGRGYTPRMAQAPALPAGFELPLEPRLPRIGSIDQVALEERAATLAKRSIKRESKVFALELAVRMIDLTTLEGADTPGKVAALASKAVRPDPTDASVPSVAALCVYPNLVPTAVERLAAAASRSRPSRRPSRPASRRSRRSSRRCAGSSSRAPTRSTWSSTAAPSSPAATRRSTTRSCA